MKAVLAPKQSNETRTGTPAKPFFAKSEENSFFSDQEHANLFFPNVQARLNISSPSDPQEKEADAVADQVMRVSEPIGTSVSEGEDELLLSEEKEEESDSIQTKSNFPESKAIQCQEEEELQTKIFSNRQQGYNNQIDRNVNESDETGNCQSCSIQRKARGPPNTTSSFEQKLSSSKGGGNALPGETKKFMESRFNADFSGVRIHTGSHAEDLSWQINAQAFAHGNDIYFNKGKFSPGTSGGGKLLAHELTHTIQQGTSKTYTSAVNRTVTTSEPIQKNKALDHSGYENNSHSHSKVEKSDWHVDPSGKINMSEEYAPYDNLQIFTSLKSVHRKAGSSQHCKCEAGNNDEQKLNRKQTSSTIPSISSEFNFHPKEKHISLTEERDRGPPSIALFQKNIIQCSVIDTALGQVGSVTDCVNWDYDEAKACVLRKAQQVALNIPGYRALRVVLSQDPITGQHIDRNGRNFIEAAFDIMPGGMLLHKKLDEQKQLDAAAAWIDTKIASITGLVEGLISQVRNFLNNLGVSDLTDPMQVLRDGANIVLGFVNKVIDFAVSAAKELLEMVKQFLRAKIVDFIKEQTPAYPLLTVILGKDPITEQEVEPNGTNILNAILELGGEEGIQQREQMQDTGTFQKVAGYIDEGIVIFSGAYNQIVQGFRNIWEHVTIENLMEPVATFQSIYNEFAEPVLRVLNFVVDVGRTILQYIKEVLMQRLSNWAKTVRGYPLITVILGKDPFTDEEVPRSMHNIIRGFFSLMEGGEEQYNQLKESGAIDRTVKKVEAAVESLNMTPAYIIQLFLDLWNSFTLSDLANPLEAFQRIIDRFGEPIGRLISFVVEIVKIVIEAVLVVMKFPFDVVNNIIAKAMQAFDMIKRDPVGFLKNLLRAVKQGFIQFFDNILQHLLSGLVGWLTSELREAGVPEITDTSLRGIITWVLELLHITMEKIWEKLAAHPRIGPQRVARIRGMINTLEGIWTFIKDVQERGMAAIWDKIQEQLSNLWNTILDSIKNWVMEQIINKMVTKLLSMLDPTGIMAVVNSVIALYNAIESFVKYIREMLEIVNSFVEGVVEIASGNITSAANFLERSLGRAVPIVIGFLANQVGLSGIGRRIGELIGSAREMVDRALTWLVNKAVDTGMNLLDRLMGRGNGDGYATADGDVKVQAENRLNELINPNDSEEQVQQKIATVKGELQQYGLSDLRMVPDNENEGEFYIDAAASPFTHVLKLIKQLAGTRTPTARCQVSIKSFNKQDLSFIVSRQEINKQFNLDNGTLITLPKTYAVGEKISNSEVKRVATRAGRLQDFAMIERSGGSWSIGGALLIPEPGADEIKLLAWNTDTPGFNSASNASHAEYQFRGWLQSQPNEFLKLIKGITININLSPCDDCCAVLSNIVTGIVEPNLPEDRRAILRQNLDIRWTRPYCKGINSNEKTTNNGVAMLEGAGWNVSGQVHENCNEGFEKRSLV